MTVREIIKDTLEEYSYDEDAQPINLTSQYAQSLLAEALERRLRERYNLKENIHRDEKV